MNKYLIPAIVLALAALLFGCPSATSNPSGNPPAPSHMITFDANGGSGTMAKQTATQDASLKLTTNSFSRTGSTFGGWATSATGSKAYDDGANYTMGKADVTLYAVWAANSTSLANLVLTSNSTALTLSPVFASATTSYTVLSGTSLTLTPTQSVSGQSIAYRQDSGSWVLVPSGTNSTALTIGASSTLTVRVTASDGVTQGTYTIAASSSGPVIYDKNGADTGSVPTDAGSYSLGATVTVLGNTGTLGPRAGTFSAGGTRRQMGVVPISG